MKHPETSPLFSGTQPERLSALEERLAKAIEINSTLSQSVTAERRRQNTAWADAALASANSRPSDLFSLTWWQKNKPSGKSAGSYANWKNGTVQSIHGKVDLASQRVAFDIGSRANLTIETGLTNLTNDRVRLWAHLPNQHSQTWFLARMRGK